MNLSAVVLAAVCFCVFGARESNAVPWISSAGVGESVLPVTKVVVFGPETRQTADDFAQHNHLNASELKRQHSGSGVIHCGNARGAGQLTLTNNVLTTASHVFYNESGQLRGDSAHCSFTVVVDGREIVTPIDTRSIVAGSTNPYNEIAVHDWAVARLVRPLPEATPYTLGAAAGNIAIRFVARGHSDWGGGQEMSMESCRLRDGLEAGAEGTREFSFDCAAGVGASGGALLSSSGNRLLAVFVGFRSTAPDQRMSFSSNNYNFGVTVEGAFRRAILDEVTTRTASVH
jgi:hypothetical protein